MRTMQRRSDVLIRIIGAGYRILTEIDPTLNPLNPPEYGQCVSSNQRRRFRIHSTPEASGSEDACWREC